MVEGSALYREQKQAGNREREQRDKEDEWR